MTLEERRKKVAADFNEGRTLLETARTELEVEKDERKRLSLQERIAFLEKIYETYESYLRWRYESIMANITRARTSTTENGDSGADITLSAKYEAIEADLTLFEEYDAVEEEWKAICPDESDDSYDPNYLRAAVGEPWRDF